MFSRTSTRASLTSRWATRRPNLLPSFTARASIAARDFHLQSKDIPKFLTEAGVTLPSSVKIESSSTTASEGVAFLISADRDPQPTWPNGEGKGKFYGPSILFAPLSSLSSLDSTYFGQGGLGLLSLRRKNPSAVAHATLRSNTSSLPDSQVESLVHGLDSDASSVVQELWKVFDRQEGLWFTFILQPSSSGLSILNPYLEFDDFSVRRQPLLSPYYSSRPRDPNTARAEDGSLFYVKLSHISSPTPNPTTSSSTQTQPEGNVGCFGYGAGNAMATMDGLNVAGGRSANFLDGGGGANRTNAKLAVETLNRDEAVKAIFVNTFGGITRTDIVAQGIIDAVKDDQISKPIVVRMKGTGAEDAKKTLEQSGLEFAFHDDFNAAAAHAVRAANQGHL
ncbi:hypothetical protein NDA16_001621 [Ustilago loliicola]|nr:hypothetical protein NDA16_001621 [Ustilago loliicola]